MRIVVGLKLIYPFLFLTSCAATYTSLDGTKHRIGFFLESEEQIGELLTKSDQALGLRFDLGLDHFGMSVGYRGNMETFLLENEKPVCFSSVGRRRIPLRCDEWFDAEGIDQ